jgi:hypothetical protein
MTDSEKTIWGPDRPIGFCSLENLQRRRIGARAAGNRWAVLSRSAGSLRVRRSHRRSAYDNGEFPKDAEERSVGLSDS